MMGIHLGKLLYMHPLNWWQPMPWAPSSFLTLRWPTPGTCFWHCVSIFHCFSVGISPHVLDCFDWSDFHLCCWTACRMASQPAGAIRCWLYPPNKTTQLNIQGGLWCGWTPRIPHYSVLLLIPLNYGCAWHAWFADDVNHWLDAEQISVPEKTWNYTCC